MMRVLHVISGIDPENGGPTSALLGLTKAQARLGLDVTVLATWRYAPGRDNADTFRNAGVKVTMVGPARGKLSRHPDLSRVVDQHVSGADVVHIHALFEEIQHLAARACQRRCVPYLMRPCGALDPWAWSRGRFFKSIYLALRLRRNLNRAAFIHYTTDTERDASAHLGLIAPTIVEPNGVDLDEFTHLPGRGGLRKKFPILKNRPIVLFLGRLDPKKGIELLIEAFAGVLRVTAAPTSSDRQRPVLVLAGPDVYGYQRKLESDIAGLQLTQDVVFTGMLPGQERIEALVDTDVFAMTSHVENFGVAVVEAMATGVACVVSERVNVAPAIRSASAGVVVSHDIPSITAALQDLLASDERRASLGTVARAFALARYDWAHIARRWESRYYAVGDT